MNKYVELQNEHFELGDLVKFITDKPCPNFYLGWATIYNHDDMQELQTKAYEEQTVLQIKEKSEYGLKFVEIDHYWPFFFFEKIGHNPLYKVGEYGVHFKKDGGIKVGCTDVDYLTIDAIYQEATRRLLCSD